MTSQDRVHLDLSTTSVRSIEASPYLKNSETVHAVNSWSLRNFEAAQGKQLRRRASQDEKPRRAFVRVPMWPTPSHSWNLAALFSGFAVFATSAVTVGSDQTALFDNIRAMWCEERLVCAATVLMRLLYFVSRTSAGMIYVTLAFTFATVMHATATFLGRKPQIIVSNGLFGTAHSREAHFRGGKAIGILGATHAAAHLCRYALAGEVEFLWALRVPMIIAGIVTTLCFVSIKPSGARKKFVEKVLHCLRTCCCRCRFSAKKKESKLSYETWMLVSHHLLIVSALIAGAMHHPRFGWMILVVVSCWTLDRLYLKLCRTFVVEAPHFVAVAAPEDDYEEDDQDEENDRSADDLASGTLVAFANPPGFEYETGDYVKIRFPWLAGAHGKQEHAFSLAPIGSKETKRSMLYMSACGDWTRAVWNTVRRCGNGFGRPMLIAGPYAAPFNTSFTHNFILVVASGVGITPILSVVERFGATRRIVVLWICRDAALLRLYADYLHASRCQAHVYFTGDAGGSEEKTDIAEDLQRHFAPVKLHVGRPDVKQIARSVLSGAPLPFTVDDLDLEGGADDDDDEVVRHSSNILTPPPSTVAPADTIGVELARNSSMAQLPHTLSTTAKAAFPRLNTKEFTADRCDEPTPNEWRVLYCGGSKTVSDMLQDVSHELGATYACESFWL